MPIASSFDDGTMSINSSRADESHRTTLSFQALPSLNGVFRYSGVGTSNWGYTRDSGYNVWDSLI